jgi:transposase-like protein
VLHRWRRELQDYGTKAFAGNGQRRVDEAKSPNWNGR